MVPFLICINKSCYRQWKNFKPYVPFLFPLFGLPAPFWFRIFLCWVRFLARFLFATTQSTKAVCLQNLTADSWLLHCAFRLPTVVKLHKSASIALKDRHLCINRSSNKSKLSNPIVVNQTPFSFWSALFSLSLVIFTIIWNIDFPNCRRERESTVLFTCG